jgi:hypothetical protein
VSLAHQRRGTRSSERTRTCSVSMKKPDASCLSPAAKKSRAVGSSVGFFL